jgi:organizing structure protein 2
MVTLVETPHPISPYIAQAREATTDVLGGAKGYVEEGVSKWIGFEKRVERELPPLYHNSGLEAE